MSHPSVFKNLCEAFLNVKNAVLIVCKKIIQYLCEGWIQKSVPRDHCLSSRGKPRDFFYAYLTLMMDSDNLTYAVPTRWKDKNRTAAR